MPTNAQIMAGALAWMRAHVGLAEKPWGSNIVPLDGATLWKHMRPSYEGGAWCACAADYAYFVNGLDMRLLMDNPFYCPFLERFAKEIGAWKTDGGNAGDLVLYDIAHQGLATHVGISWPDPKAVQYRALEGNTSPGTRGSQANGGGLYLRYRPRAHIRGWIDMGKVIDYARTKGALTPDPAPTPTPTPAQVAVGAVKQAAAAVVAPAAKPADPILVPGMKSEQVRRLQLALRMTFPAYSGRLATDGDFGPATKAAVMEFQRRSGLTPDGEVGPATRAALARAGAKL